MYTSQKQATLDTENYPCMYPRKLLTLLCLLLLSAGVWSQDGIRFEKESFDGILHKAKEEHKTVMIYFTGSHCGLCIKMEKNVFPQPDIASLYNKSFINFESFDDWDKPDSATKRLRRRYGIISNPTFVFIDGDGDIIHKSGYKNTEDFLITGKQALSDNDNYRAWSKEIQSGNISAYTLAKFLTAEQKPSLYRDADYQCRAQEVLDRYFSSISKHQYSSAENWDIILRYVANPYSDVFSYLLDHIKEFGEKYGEKAVARKIYDVYDLAWSGATNTDYFRKAVQFIRSSERPSARLFVQIRDMRNAGNKMTKTDGAAWDTFVTKYDKLITTNGFLMSDGSYLPDWAESISNCASVNRQTLQKANAWMAYLLSLPANQDYDYYATYARTFSRLGNKQEAAKYQQKAIELAIQDEADKEDIEAFRKTLATYR